MAMKGGNPSNLKPVSSVDEARKKGHAGGIASARKRQERKSMAETLDILLKMPIKAGKVESLAGAESLEEATKMNLSAQDIAMAQIMRKAMNGDIRAMEFIRDTLGDTPQVVTVSPLDSLSKQLEAYEESE